MRVLYDYQAFTMQRHGGVSRYFAELAAGLPREGIDVGIAHDRNDNEYAASLGRTWRPFIPPVEFRGRRRAMLWLNRRAARAGVRDGRFDIFHPTYYDPYFLPLLGGRPYALTVYDMIHELFPHCFAPGDPTVRRKRVLAHGAALVIAISESTRRDLSRLAGIPEERIVVVPLATSMKPVSGPARLPVPAGRYLLHVGQRDSYKNFPVLAAAAGELLLSDDLYLVCAGGRPFTADERESFAALGIAGRVLQVKADDAALAGLYAGALAFVFPSLYEGFGLPLLEAFACGCPVAASGVSSLPEVADEAAVYFDPRDRGSIQEVLGHLVRDRGLRERLVTAGTLRLRDFSWNKTVSMTAAAYRAAVGR